MASRDFLNQIQTVNLIPPTAALVNVNTPIVSSIIDTAGYEGVTLVLITGTETDADATFTALLEDGDQANLSDNSAVSAQNTVGTAALASFTFASDNVTRKIGYVGPKRYVRLTVTPLNNDAGSIFLSGVAILGYGRNNPQLNPSGL
jgi:hypothetical protein